MTNNILIIGGALALKRELTSVLSEASFAVTDVSDYPEALLKLNEFNPDLVIVDKVLPSGDGRDACFQLHHTFGIPVILMGKDSSDKAWERAIQAGADFYLKKPFSYLQLVARVRAILRRHKKLQQNRSE